MYLARQLIHIVPFTKIRVAKKTSESTTPCRLSEFDTANRTFGFGITYIIRILGVGHEPQR